MDSRTARREAAQRREDETIYCDAVSYALLWSMNQIVQQAPALVLMLTAFGYAAPTSDDEPMSIAYSVLVSVWLATMVAVAAFRIVEDVFRPIKVNLWKGLMFVLSFFVLMVVTFRLNFTDDSLEDQIREGDTRGRIVALVLVLASLVATNNFNISDRLLRTRQLVSVLTAASLALVATLVVLVVFLLYDVSDLGQMASSVLILASGYAWYVARSVQPGA